MDLNSARQTIADMQAGRIQWDDNRKASAQNILDQADPNKVMEKAIQRQREAVQPAVQSLEASRPEISQKYSQTREQLSAREQPLQERYKNLLASIKGQGEQDINKQTVITSNELGKRGLVGSSTLAQQEIQDAVSPLRQRYAGLEKDTMLAQEDDLRGLRDLIANLAPQETADMRAISNAVAQLQSGAGQTGIAQGMQLYQSNLDNVFRDQQLAEQKRQNEIAQQLASIKDNYLTLSEGQTVLDPNTGTVLYTSPKTYRPESSSPGLDISGLMNILGGGGGATSAPVQTPSTFQPLSTSTKVGQRAFSVFG
jgi:hypothetical protein